MKKVLSFKNIVNILIVAILSIITSKAFCNPVDVNKAQQIGKKFLKNSVSTYSKMSSDFTCDLTFTYKNDDNETLLYVFNVSNIGFVIVSAEDQVSPILGYSTEGNFDPNNYNVQYFLNDFKYTINHVRSQKIKATEEIQEQWRLVESIGRINNNRNGKAVEPLCSTTWNQNKYYNRLCPEDPAGPDGHVYAGCVATAMGQVMKFWNYPAIGSGEYSYTPWGYPTQTANFGETNYNFNLMPNYLDSTSTDEEINAVATLLWHCGISVDMQYSPNGSGAFSTDVPDALINHFVYQNSLYYQSRYFSNNWDNQLRENLDDGQPLYYSGQDDNGAGGHAFVCDGYDDNNMFHFNLGWSGIDNGYYPSNAINTTHGPYYFNSSQGAIFDIAPNSEYYNKATSPTNFVVTPGANFELYATLSWNNPTIKMNSETIDDLISIVLKRDGNIIATFDNPELGAEIIYVDTTIDVSGSYSYSVHAVTSEGDGLENTKTVFIGPCCDLIFHLHDAWGDGWNGNSHISIRNDNNVEIASVRLESGSEKIDTVSLLVGTLKFYWVPGYYDSENSFEIYNSQNELIYETIGTPLSGLFLTYDNQCSTDMPGDANGDGVVNISDIMVIVAYIYNNNPEPFFFDNADVNDDGNINILDIILICKMNLSK